MVTKNEMFPSRILKAEDLKGKPWVLHIVSAPNEVLKFNGQEDTKTVLYFKGTKKVLPLNKTNWESVEMILGPDSDDWPGGKIEVYPTVTDLRGKQTDCVRVRRPSTNGGIDVAKSATPAKVKAKPAADDGMDDPIPF